MFIGFLEPCLLGSLEHRITSHIQFGFYRVRNASSVFKYMDVLTIDNILTSQEKHFACKEAFT